MSRWHIAGIAAGVVVVIIIVSFGVVTWLHHRQVARLEDDLHVEMGPAFHTNMVQMLPDPARRYLQHSIDEGTPLHGSVRLVQKGWMKLDPDKPHAEITAEERLTPAVGFLWRAQTRVSAIPVSVTDHYLKDDGAVRVTLLGALPVVNQKGDDVARSSRGRLVAESLWCPTALVDHEAVRWEAVDDGHVRLVQTVDGEDVAVTLAVDDQGRLTEIVMNRWGDTGPEDWGDRPYGFEVLEEDSFQGVTIPTKLQGGWWYGTDRYAPDDASRFEIVEAQFTDEP